MPALRLTRFNKLLVSALISGAMLVATAQAMEIRQFDKMADQDHADYIRRWWMARKEFRTMGTGTISPTKWMRFLKE